MGYCKNCHSFTLNYVETEKVVETGWKPGQSYTASRSLRHGGHPIAAGIITAISFFSSASNFFWEKRKYKCSKCGLEESSIVKKETFGF